MPTFSIIIPFYNTEYEFYKRTFACLKDVPESFAEVLVIDDGSDCAAYQELERYLHSEIPTAKLFRQENGGQNMARQYGLERAEGDYVFFLDSDDYLEPSLLIELGRFLEKRSPDVVAFNYDIVSPEGRRLESCEQWRNGFSEIGLSELVLTSDSLCRQCYSLKKIKNLNYGLVQGIRIGEDLSSSMSINLALSDCWSFDGVLYHYVKRPTSIIHNAPSGSAFDIFVAFDEVLSRCGAECNGCRCEVEWMAILHCLGWNSIRLLRAGADPHEAKERTFLWMQDNFPEWKQNKYIRTEPVARKLWFRLASSGCWNMLAVGVSIWDKIKTMVHRELHD